MVVLGVVFAACGEDEKEKCDSSLDTGGATSCGFYTQSDITIGSSSRCSYGLSECQDDHEYQIQCEGSDCSCLIDGVCTKRASGSCDSLSALNEACGWQLTNQ